MTEEPQKKRLKVMQSDDGDYEIFVRSQGLQHIAENIFSRLDLQCLLECQIVCIIVKLTKTRTHYPLSTRRDDPLIT